MVSTHQQYLCPDYLSPLPSTLDSNKSPLALLAQTCNSIGLPDPSTSKAKPNNLTENCSTKNDKNVKDDAKGCKTSSSQADSTSDATASDNGKGKESPSEKKSDMRHQPNSTTDDLVKSETNGGTTSSSESASVSSSDPKLSAHQTNSSAVLTVNPSLCSTSKCGTPFIPPGYPPHMFSHYFPPTSASGYPYSHGVIPSLPLSCYPGLQTNSLPMFPRLCTDPFCKSCPPNSTMASLNLAAPTMNGNGRACPFGCTQCTTHPADLSMWLNSYSLLNGGFHGLTNPSMPPSLASLQSLQGAAASNSAALAAAAAAATNPFMAQYPQNLGGQNIPPICWWNSGEGYCLKRFSNAEELLQHLRTHAHESATKNSLMNVPSMPSQMASVGGRLSPRSSTYLNSLNSLRYHPYNKLSPTSSSVAPSVSSLPHIPFPSLNAAAYSLQSSLYSAGQRLPGSLPHP